MKSFVAVWLLGWLNSWFRALFSGSPLAYQKTTLVGAAMDPATQAVLVFGQYDTLMEELQRESQGDLVSFLRIDPAMFHALLVRVGPRITKVQIEYIKLEVPLRKGEVDACKNESAIIDTMYRSVPTNYAIIV